MAGQEDYFTASTINTHDVSTLSQSTNPTVCTNTLTNYSLNLDAAEEANGHISETTAIMRSTVEYTSIDSPSELELTHHGKTSEESELGRTTLFITNYIDTETFNGLSGLTETGNDILETSTGVRIEVESATSTVSVRETLTGESSSVAPVSTISNVTDTTEVSGGLLEKESTVTSECEVLTAEQFSVTEPDSIVPIYPDIPDFNEVSSTTDGPMFPFTIPSISFGEHAPSLYHSVRPGRFAAGPSCAEYHICRLAGFWFVHFRQTCHFGLQFSPLFRFCVPSYLSDCKIDAYLANGHSKTVHAMRGMTAGQANLMTTVKKVELGTYHG
jgi:hypothetical protein